MFTLENIVYFCF